MNKKIIVAIFALLGIFNVVNGQRNTDKPVTLDEVVVTASRMGLPVKKSPQKVEIINKRKIETIQADNVADLLKKTVNLDIIQYPGASAAVGMRGFAPSAHNRNYTLVLVDGKPAGTTNLTSLPTDFIERIEVVKGPYSVLYGSDAMGGVINIITKEVSDSGEATMRIGGGSFGQFNFSEYANVPLTDKLGFALGLSRKVQTKDYTIGSKNILNVSEKDKLILDKKSYGDEMTNTQYNINQLTGKVRYKFNNAWDVNLMQMVVISNDIQTPGNYWHSYGLSSKDFSRFNTMLHIQRATTNNTLLVSPYFSNYYEDNYNDNTDKRFVNSKEHIQQYGVKLSDTHRWGDFQLIGGIDIDAHKVSSEKFSDKFTASAPYRPNHSSLASSVFAQGAYQLNNFFLNAGVRYSYTHFTLEADEFLKNERNSTGYSNLNPSVGLKYFIAPFLNVHASFGNAFYVPDAYKTAGAYQVGKKNYKGNPDLKPETSTSYDVGVTLMKNNWLHIDATYFDTFYKNKIVTDNDMKAHPDYITYKNSDEARMKGLEVLLSTDIMKAFQSPYSLEIYGSFTHIFNKDLKLKKSDNSVETKEMLYVRKNTGNFGITFDNNKSININLNARYIGNRLENDWMVWDKLRPDIKESDYYAKGGYTASDKILEHPAHIVFDASAYYTICKRARLGISVSNLLDENFTEKDGYNMPGRSIMGSFSYTFF